MLNIIRSDDRGATQLDWLRSKHTFSFADYYDPERINFGSLRVINEDWIDSGKGFGMHPHRDMEIITYMIDGELSHKDSMGNGSVIRPGELQRMSAGTGVLHSEFNTSATETAHLLQIWIMPEAAGLQPGYEQKSFASEARPNRWQLIGSRDGKTGSLTIHQDVNLYEAVVDAGQEIEVDLHESRKGFLQVVYGNVTVGEEELVSGDAVTIENRRSTQLRAAKNSRLLLFDMG
jgi:redox-sensitive bicupin YhaK (pirin superfamily)